MAHQLVEPQTVQTKRNASPNGFFLHDSIYMTDLKNSRITVKEDKCVAAGGLGYQRLPEVSIW